MANSMNLKGRDPLEDRM